MQIDDTDEIGLLALPGNPLLDRTQIVTDMQVARRLDA
jgi:hypothetical protein